MNFERNVAVSNATYDNCNNEQEKILYVFLMSHTPHVFVLNNKVADID